MVIRNGLLLNKTIIMKVYYAHSMHLYNTPQEKRDIELLEKLNFEVLNPNTPETQQKIDELKANHISDYMSYFKGLIDSCDCFAFRSHVDGKIPSGVVYELEYALSKDKPTFELPSILLSRFLNTEDTRRYLAYNGQR